MADKDKKPADQEPFERLLFKDLSEMSERRELSSEELFLKGSLRLYIPSPHRELNISELFAKERPSFEEKFLKQAFEEYFTASFKKLATPKGLSAEVQQLLDAVSNGNVLATGIMIKKNPGLLYISDDEAVTGWYRLKEKRPLDPRNAEHAALIEHAHTRFMHSQKCPLQIIAEDAGQKTLGRIIGIFDATHVWEPSGQFHAAYDKMTAAAKNPPKRRSKVVEIREASRPAA